MAMKDFLGKLDLDRFKKAPSEPAEADFPVPEPVEEKPSFVFTDINSEPIGPSAAQAEPEAPAHSGAVQIESSNDDRIQLFELDLGGGTASEAPTIPEIPEMPEIDDTIIVTPASEPSSAEDYEEDFGYAAPGALDDVTYTTAPETIVPPKPEPVVMPTADAPAADNGDSEEYYDSYEPLYEDDYTAGMFFQKEPDAAPYIEEETVEAAPVPEEPVYEAPAEEVPTYTEEQPRYENYRKDYQEAPENAEPRSYENNIDDTVFLADNGEPAFSGGNNRRRWIIALVALLLAVLVVLGALFLARHNKSADSGANVQTSAKITTTAFERSVSNNAEATETTTEEPSAEYDENGETSARTTTTYRSSTSTRSTTRSSSSTGTTSSTTRSTTHSTTTTTTTAPTTTTLTPVEPTTPSAASTTAKPSPWDHVNS